MGSSPLLRLLFLFSLSFSFIGGAAPDDLASDRAALLAFRAAVSGVTRRWNVSAPLPCAWYGVTCSANRVTELRLPGSHLSGHIPPGTVGNLTALVMLSLRNNILVGTLPPDFAALSALRYLHLQNNGFSGGIPSVIFSLRQLIRLNLGGNSLDGGIPLAFNNMTALSMLYLDRNRLSGEIPELQLPRLNQFNVSFNRLNGSIPASLRRMPASSFDGNSLCGGNLGPCPGESSPSPAPAPLVFSGDGRKKLSDRTIHWLVIGSAVGFLILLLISFLFYRKGEEAEAVLYEGGKMQLDAMTALRGKKDIEAIMAGPPPVVAAAPSFGSRGGGSGAGRRLVFTGKVQRIYDLEDLLRASAEVLGKGTTGTTYKAMLEMGMLVAVKRLRDVNLSEKEFHERMEAIGTMDHPNLVALQAYYYSKEEKLLVYEVVPNGSLSATLHGNKISSGAPLDWVTRLRIALGAARGIEFIHLKGSGVSHGNIKSSNVLLTKSREARISDFGLNSLGSVPMPNQRTSGYRAPEVTDVRKVSQKADVYSFGVLLMEMLTRKSPVQATHNEDGVDLPRWVLSVDREEWSSEVFDLELLKYQNNEELVQLLELAIDCVAQVPQTRPSMSEVVARIEAISSSTSSRRNQQQYEAITFPLP